MNMDLDANPRYVTRYHLEKLEALLLQFLSLHLGHHVPALCKAPTQHGAALVKEMLT